MSEKAKIVTISEFYIETFTIGVIIYLTKGIL